MTVQASPLVIDENTPVEALLEQFEKDIHYDVHPVERKVNSSRARKELQRRGAEVLGAIGTRLFGSVPAKGFMELEEGHREFFLAWVYLIGGIIDDHNLENRPYDKTTRFGDQHMGAWIAFCQRFSWVVA